MNNKTDTRIVLFLSFCLYFPWKSGWITASFTPPATCFLLRLFLHFLLSEIRGLHNTDSFPKHCRTSLEKVHSLTLYCIYLQGKKSKANNYLEKITKVFILGSTVSINLCKKLRLRMTFFLIFTKSAIVKGYSNCPFFRLMRMRRFERDSTCKWARLAVGIVILSLDLWHFRLWLYYMESWTGLHCSTDYYSTLAWILACHKMQFWWISWWFMNSQYELELLQQWLLRNQSFWSWPHESLGEVYRFVLGTWQSFFSLFHCVISHIRMTY